MDLPASPGAEMRVARGIFNFSSETGDNSYDTPRVGRGIPAVEADSSASLKLPGRSNVNLICPDLSAGLLSRGVFLS